MLGEHEEVVAAPGSNREPTHVISIKLADGFSRDVELLCLGHWGSWRWVRFGFGITRALPGLGEMSLERINGDGKMLVGIGIS